MATTRPGRPFQRVPFTAGARPSAGHPPGAWIDELRRADGAEARDLTRVALTHDGAVLSALFHCQDRHIWGTFARRDDPLWQEEVVELFLAPGSADPVEYFEFEISPNGILFDAKVRNPRSRREDMRVDPAWDCDGIEWAAEIDRSVDLWRAELRIPLASLAGPTIPRVWRANFFRIERPADGPAEYSCWSPTHTDPPDFHKPRRFGILELAADPDQGEAYA